MVSFQCDGCSDVVKKPKLDQHRGKCNSTFTCIDCFTTFNGPSEYKSHTSCITEAEKYQKSLYKGPKSGKQNGAPKGSSEPKEQTDSKPTPESKPAPSMNTIHPSRSQTVSHNANTNGARPSWNDNPSRGGFGGGRGGGGGGYGGYGGGRIARYEGTGANVTPLGTPARMSPFTAFVPDEANAGSSKVNGTKKTFEDSSPQKASKAKSTPSESITPSSSKSTKKDNKSKKDKSSKKGKEVATEVNGSEEAGDKKKSKADNGDEKSKKRKREAENGDGEVNGDVNGKKSKKDKKAKSDEPAVEEKKTKEKKEKKEKKSKKSKDVDSS